MKIVCPIILVGVALFLSYIRPYELNVRPDGSGVMRVTRTHWIKPNQDMLLRWRYDQFYEENGWCAYVQARDETRPQWHLVLRGDGETFMATYPGWWRDM